MQFRRRRVDAFISLANDRHVDVECEHPGVACPTGRRLLFEGWGPGASLKCVQDSNVCFTASVRFGTTGAWISDWECRTLNEPLDRPATVVYCAVSLDGYIARPDGDVGWLGEGLPNEDYGWSEFIPDIDHILMGRATFEKVVEFGSWHYGDTPLTVLSTTLSEIPESFADKADVASAPPRELLERLAALGARRVYVDGGATVQSFLAEDLIDELVLTTVPVLIGAGIPLFGALPGDLRWKHESTRTFPDGLVKNRYSRNRET